MGRYYDGDISGKFMFGVQDSNAADRFGSIGETDDSYEDETLIYSFNRNHLNKVSKEIYKLEESLNKKLKGAEELLDNFFSDEQIETYNNRKISRYFTKHKPEIWKDKYKGFKEDMVQLILSDYADLKLGRQIQEQLMKHGTCGFEADN